MTIFIGYVCQASPCEVNSSIFCGDPLHLRPVRTFQTEDCNLMVMEDCEGRSSLVKMIQSPDPEEQALLIIDCCASKIAQIVSVPVNRVMLLPQSDPWICCEWHTQLATLHQWAPGQSAAETLPWDGFTLQQRFRVPESPEWKKWGPLPDERKGLSLDVIATMGRHKELARIAALDTFLGNADRSRPNLYYDSERKQFFGIDQAASFRRPLARMAIQQLGELARKGFSDQELAGLQIYFETLVDLCAAVPPEVMQVLLKDLAQQSGLFGIEERIRVAVRRFSQNYADTQILIEILDDFLNTAG